MNKYVFPGADASTPLGWFVDKLEGAGFEVKSIDTIGVHYSATLWRWYRNWMANREKVEAKYGARWFRVSSSFSNMVDWLVLIHDHRFGNSFWPTPPLSPVRVPPPVTRLSFTRTLTLSTVSRVSLPIMAWLVLSMLKGSRYFHTNFFS